MSINRCARLYGFHHRSQPHRPCGRRPDSGRGPLGRARHLDRCHLRLKKRARGLTEAESILAVTEAVALGATCLDDLAIARSDQAQEELRGYAVPAPQTAGAFLRRFSLGHIGQLNEAHASLFSAAGYGSGTVDGTFPGELSINKNTVEVRLDAAEVEDLPEGLDWSLSTTLRAFRHDTDSPRVEDRYPDGGVNTFHG